MEGNLKTKCVHSNLQEYFVKLTLSEAVNMFLICIAKVSLYFNLGKVFELFELNGNVSCYCIIQRGRRSKYVLLQRSFCFIVSPLVISEVNFDYFCCT